MRPSSTNSTSPYSNQMTPFTTNQMKPSQSSAPGITTPSDVHSQLVGQIDQMFHGAFQQLQQKSGMNKSILQSLLTSVQEQSRHIGQLQGQIQSVQNAMTHQNEVSNIIGNYVGTNNNNIGGNTEYNKMLKKVTELESNVNLARGKVEQVMGVNEEAEEMLKGLVDRVKRKNQETGRLNNNNARSQGKNEHNNNNYQQGISSEQVDREIEAMETLLSTYLTSNDSLSSGIALGKNLLMEPFAINEGRVKTDNRAGEQMLRVRLHTFMERIKGLQKRVEDSARAFEAQTAREMNQEGQLRQDVAKMETAMAALRRDISANEKAAIDDVGRKVGKLDDIVQEMLVEAKKLELRVEDLKAKFTKGLRNGNNL